VRARSRSLLAALLVIAFASTCASQTSAAPTNVWADCIPAPADCDGWFRGPVTVRWHTPNATGVALGTCVPAQTLTNDTVGVHLPCTAWQGTQASGVTVAEVVLRIDATPPVMSAALPDRPEDYGGWFNHPVAFSFAASDATSGLRSCTRAPYGGPDGLGVAISGSCTDMAGNSASGSFPLNYDATPPKRPSVEALPGNRRVAIAWAPSPGAQAEVVRIGKHGAPKLLYLGPNDHFTHRKLHNGRRYRYRVTLIDQAGNRVSDQASAVPTRSPLLRPANGAHVRGAPLLVWKRVKRARYYNAQLVRAGAKILSSWPRKPHLQLRRRWRFNGHVRRLAPGQYCWYVWPGLGARSEHRYGRGLGKSCFTVVR
jgi:hypothetical protein